MNSAGAPGGIRSGRERCIEGEISATDPLADAAQAHRDLEARKTHGKLLLAVRPVPQNLEPRTPNPEPRTSNPEPRTSNLEPEKRT